MAFGYRFALTKQSNGWWLLRFPAVPEALSEGETKQVARAGALDCLAAALEGYIKSGAPLPRDRSVDAGRDRVVLPSLMTAKLAVYETMRAKSWSKLRLAREMSVPENMVRRLLNLRHNSQMAQIDDALACMNSELQIALPKLVRKAA
jgi:antitoxin HicB